MTESQGRTAPEKVQLRGTGGLLALDAIAVIAITTSSRGSNESYPEIPLAFFAVALPVLVVGYLYQAPGLRRRSESRVGPWVESVLDQSPALGLVLMAIGVAALLIGTSSLAFAAFVISLIVAAAVYLAYRL